MKKIMSIRPPEEIRYRLKEYAKEKGYTVNQLVTQILWAWLKNNSIIK